jgi:hypothetical protein
MINISSRTFRTLLVVLGALNIFIGLNVALGGISTMGWQGSTSFYEVTNETLFMIRDSHMRYYGGLYVGTGLFLILAVTNLRKYQTALNLVFALIFIGGLARFTMPRADVLFGKDILVSLVVELVLIPVLYVWLAKLVNSSASSHAQPA